jgi:two-component system response regulator AlgR
MKVLVADDEPLARERLIALLAELDPAHAVFEASSGTESLRLAERERPDIVLLDIRMPDMDGLEAAGHFAKQERSPAVIFTTAYDEHALAAFAANAADYLLKPIRLSRLREAIARAQRLTQAQLSRLSAAEEDRPARRHLSATLNGNLQLVPVSQVRVFKAEQKYVIACFPDGQLLLDEPLVALEQEFRADFLRVHRGALVATRHLRGLERDSSGALYVRVEGYDEPVEVSRRLAPGVRRRLRTGRASAAVKAETGAE